MTDEGFKPFEHVVKNSAMLDTLVAIVERGPVWEYDLPPGVGVSELLALGIAVRTLVRGEDGFVGATYRGRDLYNYYFNKSETVEQAKAYRVARRAILEMKTRG